MLTACFSTHETQLTLTHFAFLPCPLKFFVTRGYNLYCVTAMTSSTTQPKMWPTTVQFICRLQWSSCCIFQNCNNSSIFLCFEKMQNLNDFPADTRTIELFETHFLENSLSIQSKPSCPGIWTSLTSPSAFLSKFHPLLFSAFSLSGSTIP